MVSRFKPSSPRTSAVRNAGTDHDPSCTGVSAVLECAGVRVVPGHDPRCTRRDRPPLIDLAHHLSQHSMPPRAAKGLPTAPPGACPPAGPPALEHALDRPDLTGSPTSLPLRFPQRAPSGVGVKDLRPLSRSALRAILALRKQRRATQSAPHKHRRPDNEPQHSASLVVALEDRRKSGSGTYSLSHPRPHGLRPAADPFQGSDLYARARAHPGQMFQRSHLPGPNTTTPFRGSAVARRSWVISSCSAGHTIDRSTSRSGSCGYATGGLPEFIPPKWIEFEQRPRRRALPHLAAAGA